MNGKPAFVPSTGPGPLELAGRLFGPEPAAPQWGDPGWLADPCTICGALALVRIGSVMPALCRTCVQHKARRNPAFATAVRTLERLERALHESFTLVRQLLERR